jgi:hypothetical protein
MDSPKKSKPTQLDLLFSADDEVAIAAIETLAVKGNKDVVVPILEVMLNASPAVTRAIESLLYQLKDKKAVEVLIDSLTIPKFEPIRPVILAAFWNSGNLPEGEIELLCSIAANGTFDEALEVLTIIENMDGPLEPEKLEAGISLVSKSILEFPDHQRKGLLESLYEELINFRQL